MSAQCRHLLGQVFGRVDLRRDEFVIAGEGDVVRIHGGELTLLAHGLHGLDASTHHTLGECCPVDLLNLPRLAKIAAERLIRRQVHRVVRDPMSLNVIRVPVGAKVVIGDGDLRANVANDLDQFDRGIKEIRAPEAVDPFVGRGTHHAGIPVATGSAQEAMVGDAQLDHGRCELLLAVRAKFVLMGGGKMCEVADNHFAFLASSARDEGDADALSGVHRHGRAGRDGLVVGMRMHEEKSSVHEAQASGAGTRPMRHDQGMTTGPTAPQSTSPALVHDEFPRQQAATHRFRLGLPRAFRISPDGSRVVFIRSSSGRDAIGSLWALTETGERLVVDGREVTSGEDLPAAEQARRERLRETTSGITTHSTDDSVTLAAFAVDGVPYVIDLVAPGAAARELHHPGPVVDPRMSPDGRHVSFVSNGSLYVVGVDTGAGEPVLLASPDNEDQSWGLADFVAAEELDRTRGCWWLADSSALLAEFVDESPVTIHWIADPAHPQREPRPHRYPAAGDANPIARLFHMALDGTRTEIEWDRDRFPYLTTVEPSSGSDAVVSVLSRDQTRQEILLISGSQIRDRRERVTTPWITMQGGVPSAGPFGQVLEIVAFDDAFGLVVDGQRLTPSDVNIDSVLDASAEHILVSASSDPRESHVASVSWTGEFAWITSGSSINAAVAGSGGMVLVHTDATHATTYEARTSHFLSLITSHAEQPGVRTRVHFATVGDRALQTALLLPTDHLAGTKLPVIMAPYGGPHAARVRYALGAYSADQWLADQGFAVVIVDGAGTPGRGPAWEFEIEHDLASVILQDQVDGLHALAAVNPDLDLTRVGITGWSFGGYLAALAVLDRPDVFHAGVAGAPVTDWALYDTAYSERYLGTPQDNPEVYRATSLIERAETLTRPLLIIHGLADDNVLASHSLRLSTALLGAGREHGFLPLSGVTHMTPQLSVAENLLRMEVAFLRDALSKTAANLVN